MARLAAEFVHMSRNRSYRVRHDCWDLRWPRTFRRNRPIRLRNVNRSCRVDVAERFAVAVGAVGCAAVAGAGVAAAAVAFVR